MIDTGIFCAFSGGPVKRRPALGLEGVLVGLKAERSGEVGASGDSRDTDFIQRAF